MKNQKEFLKNKLIEFQRNINSLNREKMELIDKLDQFNKEKLLKVIEVLDFLDTIVDNISPQNNNLEKNAAYLLKSIQAARKKINRILKREKVEEIQFPDGQAIREFSKIVDTLVDPEKKEGTILEIVKKGYLDKTNNKVIRKAELITVVRN